jgi:hypothetical protein
VSGWWVVERGNVFSGTTPRVPAGAVLSDMAVGNAAGALEMEQGARLAHSLGGQ